MINIDWDLVLKTLGAVTGAIVTIHQIRHVLPKPRTALKTDLEIFQLIDRSDPNFDVIKTNINERIQDIYAKTGRSAATEWFLIIFGAAWAITFAYVTFYIVKDGFTWWSLLTGYISLAGISIMMVVQMRKRMEQRRSRYAEHKHDNDESSAQPSAALDRRSRADLEHL